MKKRKSSLAAPRRLRQAFTVKNRIKFRPADVLVCLLALVLFTTGVAGYVGSDFLISVEGESALDAYTGTIQITYTSGTCEGTEVSGATISDLTTEWDKRLYSAQLLDYGAVSYDGQIVSWDGWNPSAISGTYTDESGVEQTAEYTAAFAGWKLTAITYTDGNGDEQTTVTTFYDESGENETEFFYPDNDNIYLNDAPFCFYTESAETEEGNVLGETTITSLTFEALWGKTVYVRDPYNFMDLSHVFGTDTKTESYSLTGGSGSTTYNTGLAIAKIEWDDGDKDGETGTVYSADTYSGATEDTPVSTIQKANELLGTAGGKIVIVNHLTIEAPENYYYNNFSLGTGAQYINPDTGAVSSSLSATTLYLDMSGTNPGAHTDGWSTDNTSAPDEQSGVVTISGLGMGEYEADADGKNPSEGKLGSSSDYENAFLYVKNTRGNGWYKNSSNSVTNYQNLNMYLRFNCDTVLEGINYLGYRESYAMNEGRETNDAAMTNIAGKRLLIEDSFITYYRSTTADQLGMESQNWTTSTPDNVEGVTSGSSTATTLSALTKNKTGTPMLYLGSYGSNTSVNVYLTIHGNLTSSYYTSFYNIYPVYSSSGSAKNVHVSLDHVRFSALYGSNNTGFSASFFGVELKDPVGSNFSPVYSSNAGTPSIDTIVNVYGGTETNSTLTNLYLGGSSNSSEGNLIDMTFHHADTYVEGSTVTNLYGGGNQVATRASGQFTYHISGGTVTNFYGGGYGGYIGKTVTDGSTGEETPDKDTSIAIYMTGGKVTNSLYGGGCGGAVQFFSTSGTISFANYTVYPAEEDSEELGLLRWASTASTSYKVSAECGADEGAYCLFDYSVAGNAYQAVFEAIAYPQNYNTNYYNLSNYYLSRYAYGISDAKVAADVSIDISGGEIGGSVYGGGKNGSVTGTITIKISGGKIGGSVYGGGEGEDSTFTQKSALYSDGKRSGVTYYFTNENTVSTKDAAYTAKTSADFNAALEADRAGCTTTNDSDNDGTDTNYTTHIYDYNNFNDWVYATYNKSLDSTYNFRNYGYSKYMTGTELVALCGGAYTKNDNLGNTDLGITSSLSTNVIFIYSDTINLLGTIVGETHVTVKGGTIGDSVFGGSDGEVANIVGDTYVTIEEGADIGGAVFGGGNLGDVSGTANTVVSGGSITGWDMGENEKRAVIFGGGNQASVGSSDLTISGGSFDGDAFGGNNLDGLIDESVTVTLSGGTIEGSLYGGGNQDECTVTPSVTVLDGTVTGAVYGGGNQASVGGTCVTIEGGNIGTVVGGGRAGNVGYHDAEAPTEEDEDADDDGIDVFIYGGTIGTVYGANDQKGVIKDDVYVLMTGGTVTGNLYGGGEEDDYVHAEDKAGEILVKITGGTVDGDVYGGGYAGAAKGKICVEIDDSGADEGAEPVVIYGSVFGGGEGSAASVDGSTSVTINLSYAFTAEETAVTTDNVDSGEITTTITEDNDQSGGDYGIIYGSVYGGGDLGQVGSGAINANTNTASVSNAGQTSVTVKNGHIKGSVFGGGSGVQKEGASYDITMGAVFGSTEVNIFGGRVDGNIYGGGTQSRLVGDTGILAAVVTIDQNHTEEGASGQIAVGGSVFGGGDRGEGDSTNASVPTTYGSVQVNINGSLDSSYEGNDENIAEYYTNDPSMIYFFNLDGDSNVSYGGGGVYGDGNLCLVSGTRTINLRNINTGEENAGTLKTFYSLQRADTVNLYRSAVVLLGALDLVVANDEALYSINRVEELSMMDGSTVKLDRIVNYLGALTSDVANDRPFIYKGYNGITSEYEGHGGTASDIAPLTEDDDLLSYTTLDEDKGFSIGGAETENGGSYNELTNIQKNVVCVANGLYLEVKNSSEKWGPVTGLFTLQMLYANPGEGGGFVYGDIDSSTGDFICETKKSNADSLGDDVFPYMRVIDDVGGYLSETDDYDYYYWYIGGEYISYELDVEASLGSGQSEFSSSATLPRQSSTGSDENLYYVLSGITVNEAMEEALLGGDDGSDALYSLVSSVPEDGLVDNQIAIELMIGDVSLGFLCYVKDETTGEVSWCIVQNAGTSDEKTYSPTSIDEAIEKGDAIDEISLAALIVDSTNDQVSFILHTSSGLAEAAEDLCVTISVDVYEVVENASGDNTYQPYADGTGQFDFTGVFSFRFLGLSQNLYTANYRAYGGIATNIPLSLSNRSAFTAEYQTSYQPAAFLVVAADESSGTDEVRMQWTISTENPDAEEEPTPLPAGLKISLLDYTSSTDAQRRFYYYICKGTETEIDLSDFMAYGTTMAICDMEEKSSLYPTFMSFGNYETAGYETERLLLIFDFSSVDANSYTVNSDGIYDACLTLHHYYGYEEDEETRHEIMTETQEDEAEEEAGPKTVYYKIDPEKTGITPYTANFEQSSYADRDTAALTVTVKKDTEWVNGFLSEGDYALKIELMSGESDTAEVLQFPTGMYFVYEGEEYAPGTGNNYVIIPINEDGTHEITAVNLVSSLSAIAGDRAYFKLSLSTSANSRFENENRTWIDVTASYSITNTYTYSLRVTPSSAAGRLLTSGGTLRMDITTALTNAGDGGADDGDLPEENEVSITLQKKQTETDKLGKNAVGADAYETISWTDVIKEPDSGGGVTLSDESPQTATIEIAASTFHETMAFGTVSNAASGTYRLMFSYGNRTEYLNFIIE